VISAFECVNGSCVKGLFREQGSEVTRFYAGTIVSRTEKKIKVQYTDGDVYDYTSKEAKAELTYDDTLEEQQHPDTFNWNNLHHFLLTVNLNENLAYPGMLCPLTKRILVQNVYRELLEKIVTRVCASEDSMQKINAFLAALLERKQYTITSARTSCRCELEHDTEWGRRVVQFLSSLEPLRLRQRTGNESQTDPSAAAAAGPPADGRAAAGPAAAAAAEGREYMDLDAEKAAKAQEATEDGLDTAAADETAAVAAADMDLNTKRRTATGGAASAKASSATVAWTRKTGPSHRGRGCLRQHSGLCCNCHHGLDP
jgi:hypothetical protein